MATASPLLQRNEITLHTSYTGDIMRKFSGGADKRRDAYLEDIDLSMTLHTDKLMQWPGGTLYVDALRNRGGLPSGQHLVGDLQGVSNIEAPNRMKIYEAWYRQRFVNRRFSLLFGLHNMGSEFYVSRYAGLFLNSSFGTGPELSLNVPNPTYPNTALGVMAHTRPFKASYLQVGLYDGDPDTRQLKASEGELIIFEGGVSLKNSAYKLGYWHHTTNKSYNNRTFSNDYGVYAIIDQQLSEFQSGTTIAGFMQWGWVPRSRNEITGYIGTGIHIHAPFPSRGSDEFGIAMARAGTHQSAETTLEITYHAAVASWLTIQPSLQWIHHPGGDSAAGTAKVGLLRFQLMR